MSRATMKTKYKTLKGFDNKMKAEKYLNSLRNVSGIRILSIKERKWNDKDKRRYYVREVVRKGVKQ